MSIASTCRKMRVQVEPQMAALAEHNQTLWPDHLPSLGLVQMRDAQDDAASLFDGVGAVDVRAARANDAVVVDAALACALAL